MAYPTLYVANGPGQRDLEQAFLARHLGAVAKFTVCLAEQPPLIVRLSILNFNYVTCQGPNYKLGGQLVGLNDREKTKLPMHNCIFIEYNAEDRTGVMEFTNG